MMINCYCQTWGENKRYIFRKSDWRCDGRIDVETSVHSWSIPASSMHLQCFYRLVVKINPIVLSKDWRPWKKEFIWD